MRTPAGKECPYYYADFHRGHNIQRCRLVEENPASLPWQPKDCQKCPVPEVAAANASPHLTLSLTIAPVLLGLGRRLTLTAACSRHGIPLENPHIGCPQCIAENPGLEAFKRALEEDHD
ncbi:MAG: hypothetical protein JXN59_10485 [Anaerolineae bacterium]|nr:hypothetical protein [Anaerolineae bacterium]